MSTSNPNQKGADEIFCRSCGEPIKKEAEICPNCGVRNETNQSRSATNSATTHDPSQYETTVSESWYWGIVAGVVLWIVGLAMFSMEPSSTIEDIAGVSILVAWIIMPIAIYFDMQYVRANSKWNPNTVLWIIGMIFWFINIVAGVVYLYRRHETVGTP